MKKSIVAFFSLLFVAIPLAALLGTPLLRECTSIVLFNLIIILTGRAYGLLALIVANIVFQPILYSILIDLPANLAWAFDKELWSFSEFVPAVIVGTCIILVFIDYYQKKSYKVTFKRY
ncbi:MAG: hypothetical protein LBV29_08050 [Azoarcus sp.]|jgi:hypothetical protein|nr:hypothetical protein [Azoarcus sp.]